MKKLTKKFVNDYLKSLNQRYPIRTKLSNEDSNNLVKLFENSPLNYINSNEYYFFYDLYNIQSRKVKMLYACIGNRKIPLSKVKIISNIFPNKSKKSPEEIHISLVKSAARNIIKEQISNFRKSVTLPIFCSISGKKLTNWKMIHIDHVIPFSKLFSDWLEEFDLSPLEIHLIGPKNNKSFKSPELINSWYNYHLEKAELQCLSSKSNLLKSNTILSPNYPSSDEYH